MIWAYCRSTQSHISQNKTKKLTIAIHLPFVCIINYLLSVCYHKQAFYCPKTLALIFYLFCLVTVYVDLSLLIHSHYNFMSFIKNTVICFFTYRALVQEGVVEVHILFFGLFSAEFLDEVNMKITQLRRETKKQNMSSDFFPFYFLILTHCYRSICRKSTLPARD